MNTRPFLIPNFRPAQQPRVHAPKLRSSARSLDQWDTPPPTPILMAHALKIWPAMIMTQGHDLHFQESFCFSRVVDATLFHSANASNDEKCTMPVMDKIWVRRLLGALQPVLQPVRSKGRRAGGRGCYRMTDPRGYKIRRVLPLWENAVLYAALYRII